MAAFGRKFLYHTKEHTLFYLFWKGQLGPWSESKVRAILSFSSRSPFSRKSLYVESFESFWWKFFCKNVAHRVFLLIAAKNRMKKFNSIENLAHFQKTSFLGLFNRWLCTGVKSVEFSKNSSGFWKFRSEKGGLCQNAKKNFFRDFGFFNWLNRTLIFPTRRYLVIWYFDMKFQNI